MAGKRFFDESGTDPDHPNGKRKRSRPSFASVIGEVVMVNCLQNFCAALEPMLRKVVNEEVENGLRRGARSITRSPSLRIQKLEPSSLKLIFSNKLSLPIFTGSKIVNADNSPLQVLLVDTTGDHLVPTSLSYPIKVEIVVLDGDFLPGDNDTWTSEEFDKNVVRERTGKRPLLTGELQITMRDGLALVGEIEFTDNSSWIRSRKFRVGARVVHGSSQGVRVREAMTESFVVKDHRGELYKKHHPPMLEDEVWRLEKIGKDGAFHKKLASMAINTVQDFLKLSVVDQSKLRKILGLGMSEKMWEVTIKHARTCLLGNKLYLSRGANHTIILNPICQVVKAEINGQTYPTRDSSTTMNRAYIESLVRDAYLNWNSLEEFDGFLNELPLLTQGEVEERYSSHHESMARSCHQHSFLTDGSTVVATIPTNAHMECNDWLVNSTLYCSPLDTDTSGVRYHISDSSSDGDLTPTRSFIHHN
ncbi:Protein SAR DEFICIENT 1 [Camellia lanceoleosa]|uniref:Protein SAR DEFICIENT 1 n=1 Tax=Camellia lanceoleosa TaxID=1840588 RepID=A0ACC0FDI6_9ERIC|nr:Protein SAR DEFICIENT 1 [Camellia lanceoleosa]